MQPLFDHEKLFVYQRAISFISWLEPCLEKLPKTAAVRSHLDRASTSIPLNIAEGNGRFTATDRCHFFDVARGSAVECAACLDVGVAKGRVTAEEIVTGKELLVEIVSMLVGLIKSNSDGARVFEDPPMAGYLKQSPAASSGGRYEED